MLEKLNKIEKTALESLAAVTDEAALEAWRVANIGRSSPVMNVFSQMSGLSKEERPLVGQRANQVKTALEQAFAARAEVVKNAALSKSLQEERLDVTLPGRPARRGGGFWAFICRGVFAISAPADGEVTEWSIVPDSKSGVPQGTVGSNPTLSASSIFSQDGTALDKCVPLSLIATISPLVCAGSLWTGFPSF